ncbi:AAA family ATPase [Lysobacter brunescens]|uniref:AAA family ATPase n=1 Tax=Lysobacter brunescens TaxID=262323 RepID=A0ABW2Y941_9GAMM
MRRVLLIGPGGAGKSTLARLLAERLDLPLLHLDALYWQSGWVQPERDAWEGRVRALLAAEAWVMDGNFGGTLDLRLSACDTALLLDLPPWQCLWRVLRRRWMHRSRHRPDMTPGCNERIDPDFLWWIATYRWRRRPAVLVKLREAAAHGVRVEVLRSDAGIARFLAALPQVRRGSSEAVMHEGDGVP